MQTNGQTNQTIDRPIGLKHRPTDRSTDQQTDRPTNQQNNQQGYIKSRFIATKTVIGYPPLANPLTKNDPISPMQSNFEEIWKWFLSDSELIHHRQPQTSSLTFMFDFQVQIFLLSRARRIIIRSFLLSIKSERLEITSVYRITIFQIVTSKEGGRSRTRLI